MALTTLDQIKSYLNVADSSQDTWLANLQGAAEAIVRRYTQKDFDSKSYVDFLSGNNTQRLTLRQTPVTALASVHLDSDGRFGKGPAPVFDSTSLLTDGVDYVLDWDRASGTQSKSGILFRINDV